MLIMYVTAILMLCIHTNILNVMYVYVYHI